MPRKFSLSVTSLPSFRKASPQPQSQTEDESSNPPTSPTRSTAGPIQLTPNNRNTGAANLLGPPPLSGSGSGVGGGGASSSGGSNIMSGFRSKVVQNLAHTSKISFGPRDLKPLADVINCQKNLVGSTIRLASDTRKSADSLREWGRGEGDDLGDVLSKVSVLFDQLSSAEDRYCEHESTFRQHFKSIRTREENLAALKKSKDTLQSKIESLDRKVSKMSPESKDLPGSQQRLGDMRQEMIGLEHSVANEESRLADFKRLTTREAMGLKLGALLEWSEKATIVAELSKLLIEEIPLGHVEPGSARVYRGWERTDQILDEARRCLQEVIFNPSRPDLSKAGAETGPSAGVGGTFGEGVSGYGSPSASKFATANQPEDGYGPGAAPRVGGPGAGDVDGFEHVPSPEDIDALAESERRNTGPYHYQEPASYQNPPSAGTGRPQGSFSASRPQSPRFSQMPYPGPSEEPTTYQAPPPPSSFPAQKLSYPDEDNNPTIPMVSSPQQSAIYGSPDTPQAGPAPPGSPALSSPPNGRRASGGPPARGESALGSKYGYDIDTSLQVNDYRDPAAATSSPRGGEMGYLGSPSGYNTALAPQDTGSLGGSARRIPAGLFKKQNSSSNLAKGGSTDSSGPQYGAYNNQSASDRIRDQYRRMSLKKEQQPDSQETITSPATTSDDPSYLVQPLHVRKRMSALPNEPGQESGTSSLPNDGWGPPLRLHNPDSPRMAYDSELPPPPSYGAPEGPPSPATATGSGFQGGRYITSLD